jgi:hypothetical protein
VTISLLGMVRLHDAGEDNSCRCVEGGVDMHRLGLRSPATTLSLVPPDLSGTYDTWSDKKMNDFPIRYL